MLPCQPAMRVFEVEGKSIQNGIFESNGRARFEGGVKMGCLYDLAFEDVRKHVSSFWIRWKETRWDEVGGEGKEEREQEKITMVTLYYGPGMPRGIEEEFQSEAHEDWLLV